MGQTLDIPSEFFQFRFIVTVEDTTVDQVRNGQHLRFFHAAGSDRRCTDTDTAGDYRSFGVKRH